MGCLEMGECLVRGAGEFAAFGAVAVDEFVRGVGDGVADVAAGAASGGHYIILVFKRGLMSVF